MQPQLLQDFELARGRRLWDGVGLWHLNHDHGAVYLLGYHAEMTLKCAHFTIIGHQPNSPIGKPELDTALARAKILGVTTPNKSFHSVRFWADALAAERSARNRALDAQLAADLAMHASAIEARWFVEMRYVASTVTRIDLEIVSASVDWLDRNYNALAR
jgi:hypothetical protein